VDRIFRTNDDLVGPKPRPESDRNHLNAHQQIARYGTPRFPIHPEVGDTDSDDAQPARNRTRNI
jgi:hypothetical protein